MESTDNPYHPYVFKKGDEVTINPKIFLEGNRPHYSPKEWDFLEGNSTFIVGRSHGFRTEKGFLYDIRVGNFKIFIFGYNLILHKSKETIILCL